MSILDDAFMKACECCDKVVWHRRTWETDPHHKFVVEYAKSGMSTCTRGCGELIGRGEIRLGSPIADSRSCQNAISSWTHLECTMLVELRRKFGVNLDGANDCFGFAQLKEDDQARVAGELAKVDRVADKPIDPDDVAFLPQRALPRITPPDCLTVALLPYQEEGFGWMRDQERMGEFADKNRGVRGGILADEMGMGKTLQAIALLAADASEDKRAAKKRRKRAAATTTSGSKKKKKKKKKGGDSDESRSSEEEDEDDDVAEEEEEEEEEEEAIPAPAPADDEDTGGHAFGLSGTTLIILPSSALYQWQSEIERFWKGDRTPKVLVYYQNRGKIRPVDLDDFDIVLTTYPILEYEFRRQVDRTKLQCEFCSKKMLPRKLKSHYKYQCGPLARRTAGQAKTERRGGGGGGQVQQQAKPTKKKQQKTAAGDKKPEKKKWRAAYFHYLDATRTVIAEELKKGATTEAEASKKAVKEEQNKRWKALSKPDREPYEAMSLADKERYEEEDLTCAPVSSTSSKSKQQAATEEPEEEEEESASQGRKLVRRKKSTPTPSNIYRELMTAAKRQGEIINQFQRGRGRGNNNDDLATTTPTSGVDLDAQMAASLQAEEYNAVMATAAVAALTTQPIQVSSDWLTPTAAARTTKKDEATPEKRRKQRASLSTTTPADIVVVDEEEDESSPIAATTERRSSGRKKKVTEHFSPTGLASAAADVEEEEEDEEKHDGDDDEESHHESSCGVCGADGELLCCDGCSTAVHLPCADLDVAPEGLWLCLNCTQNNKQAKNSKNSKIPTLSPGKRDAAASIAKKESAAKRKRSRVPTEDEMIIVVEDDDDDGNFEPEKNDAAQSSGDDDEEEDDDDFVAEKKKKKQTTKKSPPPPKKKKPTEDDEDGEVMVLFEEEGAEREEAIDALVEAAIERREASLDAKKSKVRKANRKKRKSAADKKKKKKKSPLKGKKKKKKAAESSSSDDASSSSEDDDKDDEDDDKGETFFAAADLVTDVDGVDLRGSLLHCALWRRVILDEAHRIKGFTSSTAKAVFALRAERRWCLTGTPLQNRVKELQALVRFMRLEPYSYYYCTKKGCGCRSLKWNMGCRGAGCEKCGHTPMQHYNHFNKKILKPIELAGYAGAGARAMRLLREDVLNKVMLRRTKAERAADLHLPSLTVQVCELELKQEERDFYECIFKQTEAKFSAFVHKGTVLHNYAHIFELLARLRQALDHPYLVVHGPAADALARTAASAPGFFDLCAHCNEQVATAADCVVATCKHCFHRDCVTEILDESEHSQLVAECPGCFLPLTVQIDKLHGLQEDDDDEDDGDPAKKKKKKKPKKAAPPAKKSKVKQAQSTIDKGLMTLGITKPTKVPTQKDTLPALAQDDSSEEEEEEEEENELAAFADGAIATVGNVSSKAIVSAERDVCVVCLDAARDTMLYNCGHVCACRGCVAELKLRDKMNLCPLCREPIRSSKPIDNVGSGSRIGRNSILQRVDLKKWHTSTKVEAVYEAVSKSRREDPTIKSIVFSQYRTMLDIVEWRLRLGGLRVCKLMGDMPLAERKAVLARFKADPTISTICLSLKAGGEGLNLQEASRVYLLEPWWNPAVEMQAVQRAHRIGQTRDVVATRFITKGSIEEKMFELQEKKRLVFEGTVDGSAASFSKLTMDDLSFLFTRG